MVDADDLLGICPIVALSVSFAFMTFWRCCTSWFSSYADQFLACLFVSILRIDALSFHNNSTHVLFCANVSLEIVSFLLDLLSDHIFIFMSGCLYIVLLLVASFNPSMLIKS